MGMMRRAGLLVALVLLVVGPGVLPAQAADGQTYTVIVGVSEYKDPNILPKPTAESDAQAFYDLLTNESNRALYPADRVRLLLGKADAKRPHELATRDNIAKALKWAFTTAKEDDTIVLYWNGHGGPVSKGACFFAKDSTLDGRVKDAISGADIESDLEKTKSNRILVLLDVNFRGYKINKEKYPEFGLDKRFTVFTGIKDEDRDEEALPKPIVCLSANDGLTESPVVNGRGLFTKVVDEALTGKADRFGDEADGVVTVDELIEYFVKEYPVRFQKAIKASEPQRLFVFGRSTHFPLTRNDAAAASAAARLEKFKDLAKREKLADELVKEGLEYLTKMPKLEGQRELRKKYVEFVEGKLTKEDLAAARRQLLASFTLDRTEAEQFAARILMVAKEVQDEYVKPVKLGDMVVAAIKGLYLVADEKLPKDLQERLADAKNASESKLKTLLADARQALGNRKELKGSKGTEVALERMLHSLDMHSAYIDPETYEQFMKDTRQEFIGVGVQIMRDPVRDLVRVTTPLRGSPAYRAGLLTGDYITKVTNFVDKDGKELEKPQVTSTAGMQINDVVKLIMGKAGTKVRITVEREENGETKSLDFDIKRGRVTVETVVGVNRNPDDSWNYYIDPVNKIGYVRLTQFAKNTEYDLQQVMKDLVKNGLNGFILDLRFNPGGFLDAAVKISDLFIDDGTIVSIKPRDDAAKRTYKGRRAGSLLDFPMVVLINGGSASASEIVSACIQDQERGIVVGERSFGKGSVQNISDINLGDGTGQLKLTIASFWRPSGKNLNRFPNSKEEDDWGVSPLPEHTVKLSPTERRELQEHLRNQEIIHRKEAKAKPAGDFVDRQLEMALDLIRRQLGVKAAQKAG
jgi:C-terminal peptidase prc